MHTNLEKLKQQCLSADIGLKKTLILHDSRKEEKRRNSCLTLELSRLHKFSCFVGRSNRSLGVATALIRLHGPSSVRVVKVVCILSLTTSRSRVQFLSLARSRTNPRDHELQCIRLTMRAQKHLARDRWQLLKMPLRHFIQFSGHNLSRHWTDFYAVKSVHSVQSLTEDIFTPRS